MSITYMTRLGRYNTLKFQVKVLKAVGSVLLISFIAQSSAHAGDLSWSGRYRVEGNFIKNPTLNAGNSGQEDSYFIHHLILSPKIIPADGIIVKTRFDIFNNALGNNQAGQVFGNYTGIPGQASTTQINPSSSLSRSQQDESIVVSELNLNWVQEFGAFIAGRVPFQFGLGMYYNAGEGMFDHALSTKDIIAYKIMIGNFSIMPAYGKVRESVLTAEDDINDYMILLDYNNPESDLSMGFFFDSRIAPVDPSSPAAGNDFTTTYFGAGATRPDGYSAYNMNFYAKKKTENFNVGAELGFLSGYSGVKAINATSGQQERVELSGFGVAGEIGYKTGEVTLNLKSGLASGDDPDTSRFEGYFFSGNYDVAMLMFNYNLGMYDVLRSTLAGTRAASSSTATAGLAGLDNEVISNAIYFAPQIKWAANDHWDLYGNFCYGILNNAPVSTAGGTVGKSLGFESDLGVTYRPHDKLTWQTQLGLLLPGSAWNGPSSAGFKNDFAYGLTSKVAVSF